VARVDGLPSHRGIGRTGGSPPILHHRSGRQGRTLDPFVPGNHLLARGRRHLIGHRGIGRVLLRSGFRRLVSANVQIPPGVLRSHVVEHRDQELPDFVPALLVLQADQGDSDVEPGVGRNRLPVVVDLRNRGQRGRRVAGAVDFRHDLDEPAAGIGHQVGIFLFGVEPRP